MPLEELRRLSASSGPRRPWDFAGIRGACDPVPWRYLSVAQAYLSPLQRVLDLGTGRGEHFLRLALHFGSGIGVDADPVMVAAADENLAQNEACRVKFLPMDVAALEFPDASFDVVLNRHAPASPAEVARVLKPGGWFVTQQIGARNHANICAAFGGADDAPAGADPSSAWAWRVEFESLGYTLRVWGEYNVAYHYLDVASLMIWLSAAGVPGHFDVERHWQQVDTIQAQYGSARGIATNVHRELLVVQKTA